TIPKQVVGTIITAKQSLNNQTSGSVSTTVTQGTVADPTINPVTTDSTSVKGTGINGATVTITIGSNTYTGTVSGGEYTITIPKQAAGTVITAKQSLNSQTSNSVNTTVTQGALSAPVINTVTSDDTTITGTGMKGAVVTVTINNQDYTGLVDDNGAYSITIDKQPAGTIITAKQEINAKTSTNATTTVTQGTVTPPVVNPVTTDDTIVTGTGMKGATVKLAIGGIDYTGLVNENGTYAIAILKQPVGTIITATETLGGTTSAATIATVTQGTVAAPTINSLTTADTIVRGTGITGAVVTITIGSNTYTGTVTAGEYAITIPNQPVGTVVSAKQTLNNKTSGSVNTTVTQGAIAAPTINGVTTDSTTVTGTGLAGATVTVTIGSTPYTGTVAANGSYSITIPKQAFGTAITVKQTLNNKTSANANTTVTQGTVAAPTVGAVTTDDTTVKGTGLAGATVTVTIGSTPYTGTVAANGSYSITIPKQAFGTAITVKQTLNNKTSANASTTVTQGTVAAPTVGVVTTDDTTVKGTGLAGATVTVTIGSTPYTGTVAANGSYSITIPKQAFGTAITVKQTLNNKTSANASTTVTQGTVAAPTVGAVTTDDTTVKGTGLAGATVTVTIGSTPYTGTVAANGSYSITIPKQAAGTVISAQQTLNNKTSAAATTTVISTQTTLTADSFTIGVDNYIKGTYTGSSVAKLAIEVNGTVQQKITATGSPYQYYAKGKVTAATDQVYVISYNANGDQLKRVKVDVKSPTAGTLIPDTYYLGSDNYVTGTLSGDIVKFSLTVNGVETSKINVTTAPTFRYYANNLIRSLTDIVTVNGYDNTGKLLDSKPVTVGQDRGNPGTIATVAPFKLGKDSYVTGTYTGDIVKVELQVNNAAQQRINVAADGTIKYYAKGKINATTDVVKLVGYNSAGVAVSTKVVTVSNSDGSITANPFVIGTDSYVKGTYTGDVAKISLTVNGDKKTTITVPTPGPNYQYYAKSLITAATDVVVMTAYDATGGVLDTKTVAVSKKPTVDTRGTVTPSAYKIGTNTYVDGTYTGDVAKVALEVNGVLSASIPATGNTIHYYAGSLITNKTDVVNVIVYDATGKQLDKKPVEITAPEGTVAPNILKTTDGYLTGSATGDVAKVTLSVNGVKQASISLVQADGTYRYYVKPLALTTSDEVKVIGLDSRGNEITTADVTITN
ncbi:immunoglobulin-like domain-containing protein, partial [Listeria booriae]|uniref:immunoglobulin-like domain-containing protein n=1 Tax=Listeria booriae TaxID=1552123 RepID=UPI0016243E45